MAQLAAPFNPQAVAPDEGGGGGLPVSDALGHLVVITNSEIKPNKENTGGYLEFTLSVIDGPAKGASGKDRLNLYNNSPQAVDIAQKRLSAYCHCIGEYNAIQDTQSLHNKPFRVIVGPQSDPKYTEVKAIRDQHGNPPTKAGSGPQQGMAQPAPQQAPAQAWGGQPAQAPAAAPAWGGQQQQAPAPQPQPQPQPQATPWGQQAAAPAPTAPAQQPAWGAQQAPAQQQPAAQAPWGGGAPTQQAQPPAQAPAWAPAAAPGAAAPWQQR